MNLLEKARDYLSKERFEHTVGTLELCTELAKVWNVDIDRARVAAILHDISKDLSDDSIAQYKKKVKIPEGINKGIIHSYIAAHIARTEFGIEDKEILQAIQYHPTGHKDFGLLGLILFVSDYAERTRPFYAAVEYIRRIAKDDIYMAAFLVAREKIQYVMLQGESIDVNSVEFYNKLKERIRTYAKKDN